MTGVWPDTEMLLHVFGEKSFVWEGTCTNLTREGWFVVVMDLTWYDVVTLRW